MIIVLIYFPFNDCLMCEKGMFTTLCEVRFPGTGSNSVAHLLGRVILVSTEDLSLGVDQLLVFWNQSPVANSGLLSKMKESELMEGTFLE